MCIFDSEQVKHQQNCSCSCTDYQPRKPIYEPYQKKLDLDYQQITLENNNLSEIHSLSIQEKDPFIAKIWAECQSDNHNRQDACNF